MKLHRSRILSAVAATICIALIDGMAHSTEADNPYRKAKVGDWVTFQVSMKLVSETLIHKERRTITANDGRSVTVEVEFIDDEDSKAIELEIDVTKPLTAAVNLDFPHPGPRIREIAQGEDSLQIAGRKMDVRWKTFQIGDRGETKIWFSDEVPLNGCVKDIKIHASGSVIARELLDFGFAGHSPEVLAAKTDPALDRKPRTNSIGQTLLRIPSGDFVMGSMPYNEFLRKSLNLSDDDRLGLLLNSPPQRPKIVSLPFRMSAHEVTIGQYRQFVNDTQYKSDAEQTGRGGTGLREDGTWGPSPRFTWREYGVPVTDDHPVANVSWNDANAFCQWLSKKEGAEYRLPTEVEWEYACRAGTMTRYYCGDDPQSLADHANMSDQSLAKINPRLPWALGHDDGHAYLAPVGQFTPNAFGLYDMHGNVLEWCGSEFSEFDPLPDFNAPARSDVRYVVRGGHWFGDPILAGAASRSGAPPETSMSLIGFRVVLVDADAPPNSERSAQIDLSPTAQKRWSEAMKLVNERRFDVAAEELDQVLLEASEFVDALKARALCGERLAKWEDALQSLERAVQLQPKSVEIQLAIARVELERNNLDGARMAAERALVLDKESAAPHGWLAWISSKQIIDAIKQQRTIPGSLEELLGNLKSSLEHLKQAESLAPRDPEVLYLIGETKLSNALAILETPHLISEGRMQAIEWMRQAYDYLERSVRQIPDHFYSHRAIAKLCIPTEYNLAQGEDSLIRAVQLNPFDEFSLVRLTIQCWASDRLLSDDARLMLVYQTLAACGPQAVKPIENAVKKVKELQRNAMAASEAIAASGFEAPSVQNQLATLSRAEALFTRLLDDPKIEK